MRLLLLLRLLAAPAFAQKLHRLQATKETVHWGWLDPKETPKLTVDSGELVSIDRCGR